MIEKEELKGNKLILAYMGYVFVLIGGIILLPLIALIFYSTEIKWAPCFVVPGGVSIMFGAIIILSYRKKKKTKLKNNSDILIVLLTWVMAILIGAIPFILTGKYNITQSVFEATSGFSTTGLTIVNVDKCPHIFLLYRSLMHLVGGVGIILIITTVLSEVYNMRLFSLEGHADRIMPNLAYSVRIIMIIYLGYIGAGTILYRIFGMNLFDAINHAISAVATGGFSTRSQSIGYYNSRPIEIVSIVLMLLGGTSFYINLFILTGKFKKVFKHCETKLFLFLVTLSSAILTFSLIYKFGNTIPDAIIMAVFHVISVITTTGFQTIDGFHSWTPFMLNFIILLMIIGGSAGSTSGGLKQLRICILLKDIWWSIKKQFGNRNQVMVEKIHRFGKNEVITAEANRNNHIFIWIYLIVLMIGTIIISSFGYSIGDSLFEFASALGTGGISIGITTLDTNPLILWLETFAMMIGRLEIYIFIACGIKVIKDIKTKFA